MLSLEEVLERAGEPWPMRPRDKIVCPFHEDTSPSMHLYTTDPEHAYCFTCGEWADPYKLLKALTGETVARPDDGRTEGSRGVGAKAVALAAERRLRTLSMAFFPKLDELTWGWPWAEYQRGYWADQFQDVQWAVIDDDCPPHEAEQIVRTLQWRAEQALADANAMREYYFTDRASVLTPNDGMVGSELAPPQGHAGRPRRRRVRFRSPLR